MRAIRYVGLCLIVTATASGLRAHDPKTPTPAATAAARPAPPGSPAATVQAFHAALVSEDRDGALSWLDEKVTIFESGGAEMSRDEYASHHLASDMAFGKATKTEVVDRHAESSGDVAWVLSRTRTTGRFADRQVDADGVETMVLRKSGERWRIVHIHWSSHSRKIE